MPTTDEPGQAKASEDMGTAPAGRRRANALRIALIILLAGAAATIGAVAWRLYDRSLSPAVTTVGQAAIKSEFSLVTHLGEPVTEQTYRGRWQLVFFGFTYCPDICPTTLSTVAHVLDALGDDAGRIAPLFITVDPERDTPDVLAQYVAVFHPNLIGLTGTPEQVKAAARAFRVYYAKREAEGVPNGYLMDHSTQLFFMTPDGAYDSFYSERRDSPEAIAAAIRKRLKSEKG